jgi:hypothetical protein
MLWITLYGWGRRLRAPGTGGFGVSPDDDIVNPTTSTTPIVNAPTPARISQPTPGRVRDGAPTTHAIGAPERQPVLLLENLNDGGPVNST